MTTGDAGPTTGRDDDPGEASRLVPRALAVPFILLLLCFTVWGAAANLTDVLVGVFRRIFVMSNVESALVQVAYYGAYFCLAIPAAFINKRFGYKAGVLTGLGLAALGGFLFIPASRILAYEIFLLALFVLAAGLSILETSANPFVIAMGPETSATQRLNLAQAFNPVGANIGVLLGAIFILPRLTPESDKVRLGVHALRDVQEHDLELVLGPYLGIAAALVVIWVLIFIREMDIPADRDDRTQEIPGAPPKGALRRLLRNPHYRFGVIAQFFNVGAQVCTWSFTIQYAQEVARVPTAHSGWYLQASLLLFLVSRFVMTYLLGRFRPSKLLLLMALLGVALALFSVIAANYVGLLAVIGISLSLSLMFPTIYGLALKGLGGDTKFGSAGLVMAILGGALLPPLHGRMADGFGQSTAFIVPAICLAFVAAYALFNLKSSRR